MLRGAYQLTLTSFISVMYHVVFVAINVPLCILFTNCVSYASFKVPILFFLIKMTGMEAHDLVYHVLHLKSQIPLPIYNDKLADQPATVKGDVCMLALPGLKTCRQNRCFCQ